MIVLPRTDTHRSWADAATDPRAVGDAIAALAGFRDLLGEEWTGWARGVPFVVQFFVRLQNLPPEGVRLWQMIEQLRGTRGLLHFVEEGLGSTRWSDYVAAIMSLEFCARVRTAGGDVEFIQRTHDASPDARVRLLARWITVEFKALHDRDEMDDWHEFEQTIMDGLSHHGIAGTVFDRELTPAALHDPQAVIDGLVSVAARTSREYVPLPRGTGRARLAPINVGCCGYPIEQADETVRLTSKIRSKWWRQLEGAGHPTLLVVRVNNVFGDGDPHTVGTVARRIANAVGAHLPKLPMVGAVLVYEEPFWAPRLPAHVRWDDLRVRIDTSLAGSRARFMALVHNPHATEKLNDSELDALVGTSPMW